MTLNMPCAKIIMYYMLSLFERKIIVSQISIIIPIYNAQNFLNKCLDSIQNQTYKDFEVILINDGSKDKSAEICEEYCQRDKRFKLINQENAGPSQARNTGLDIAGSKYIAFVDADDYVAPNMFEELYCAAEKASAELTICGFYNTNGKDVCSPYLAKYKPGIYREEELKNIAMEALDLVATDNIRPYSWIRLVKKECMESPRLRFNTDIKRSEDYLIWNILFARIKCLCLITDKPLYYYVENSTSITHRYIENYWEMAKTIYCELKNAYPDDEIAEEQLNIMLIRRAYMSLNIASLSENKNQLYQTIHQVLKDKDLHQAVHNIPLKKGVSCAGLRYLLLKFRLYFLIKLACVLKYYKRHR